MSNSMSLAKKDGWEFLWLPAEYGIQGRYFNPITGCPNLRRNEEGEVEGCRTPDIYVDLRPPGKSREDGKSYCYMANKCNQYPDARKPEYRVHPDRPNQPPHTKKPSLVAVGTSGDVFAWYQKITQEVKDEMGEGRVATRNFEIMEVLKVIGNFPQHFYLFLTQSPQNYDAYYYEIRKIKHGGFGATITRKEQFGRLDDLRKIKAYAPNATTWAILEPIFFSAEEAAGGVQAAEVTLDWRKKNEG